MKAIYATMAQVHISARAILDKDFRDLGIEIFSPLKFVEFVDLFRLLCSVFCREYEVSCNFSFKSSRSTFVHSPRNFWERLKVWSAT